MKRSILSSLALVLSLTQPLLAQLVWVPLNNGIEGATAHSFTESSSGLLMGTSRGVFRLAESSDRWELVTREHSPSSMTTTSTGAVIAGGGAGIYRSSDGGTTWSKMRSGAVKGPMAIASDGSIVAYWIGSIIRSSDDGVTWKEIQKTEYTPLPGIIATTAGHLLLPLYDGLLVSSDNGLTWQTRSAPSTAEAVAVDPTGIYVATFDSLYHSPDNGTTWEARSAIKARWLGANGTGLLAIDVSIDPYGRVHDQLLGSDDGGRTWHKLTQMHPSTAYVRRGDGSVWINAYGRIFSMSADGSIAEASSGLDNAIVPKVAVSGTTLYALTPGSAPSYPLSTSTYALRRSTNGGNSWELVRDSLNANWLNVEGDRIVAAVDSGTAVVSTDGGATWRGVGAHGTIEAIATSGDTMVITNAVRQGNGVLGGSIAVTHDGGRTWRVEGSQAAHAVAILPDGNILVAIYDYYSVGAGPEWADLMQSTDGGATWRYVDARLIFHGIYPTPSGRLLGSATRRTANGFVHGLASSSDRGSTWRLDTTTVLGGIVMAPDGRLAAMSEFGTTFSSDSGRTWSRGVYVNGRAPRMLTVGSTALFAESVDVIYRLANGSNSWSPVASPMPRIDVSSIAVVPGRDRVVIGSFDGGIHATEIVTDVPPEPITHPVIHIYPNPTSGPAGVMISLPTPGAITLTLSDMLGRTISTIERMAATRDQHVALDLEHLAAGIYNVTIHGDGWHESRRVVVW